MNFLTDSCSLRSERQPVPPGRQRKNRVNAHGGYTPALASVVPVTIRRRVVPSISRMLPVRCIFIPRSTRSARCNAFTTGYPKQYMKVRIKKIPAAPVARVASVELVSGSENNFGRSIATEEQDMSAKRGQLHAS